MAENVVQRDCLCILCVVLFVLIVTALLFGIALLMGCIFNVFPIDLTPWI